MGTQGIYTTYSWSWEAQRHVALNSTVTPTVAQGLKE
jgi:hypothetical protein